MSWRIVVLMGLIGASSWAWAADQATPRDNWLELSSRVNLGYTKALRCEAGVRKSDRAQCQDFSSYMKLFYPRIAFLNTSISQLSPQQLQKIASSRDYESYKVKFNKIAEVSSDYGD